MVVHGDAAGAETLRRILTDWLTDMGLIAAGNAALVDKRPDASLREPRPK